ncbi:MAG: hypothetical protein MO846_12620, partial [Candidatus Devosia symbiotica]|nr:hypothetical protein [Candidatus Devosia symbiotica]
NDRESIRDHRHGWLRPTLLSALIALIVLMTGGVYLDLQSSTINQERAGAGIGQTGTGSRQA